MKNKQLTLGIAALSALVIIGGGIIAVQAANETGRGFGRGFENLSEEEKAERIAEREQNQSERETRMASEQKAILAGDYEAWKTAAGENSPMIKKVTADNFAKFVEAHKLMDQARVIMEEIGIDNGEGMGMGMGMGGGRGRGMGHK